MAHWTESRDAMRLRLQLRSYGSALAATQFRLCSRGCDPEIQAYTHPASDADQQEAKFEELQNVFGADGLEMEADILTMLRRTIAVMVHSFVPGQNYSQRTIWYRRLHHQNP
jgi:hypothetical protein